MTPPRNPFTPTFGRTPPAFAGRDHVLAEWEYALDQGPGAYGRAALVTGARGIGKTVVLNAFEHSARAREWAVISETATDGLLERLTTQRIPEVLDQVDPGGGRRRELVGVTIPAWLGGGGLTTTVTDGRSRTPDLRAGLNAVHAVLPEGRGLALTIDEVTTELREELRQITAVVQHGIREGHELAFAAAGIPSSVSDLLHDHPLTFLRRAQRHTLGHLPDHAVRDALAVPARDAGLPFDREGIALAIRTARGYPFLAQLLGSYAFQQAVRAGHDLIDERDVEAAVPLARQMMMRSIHEPAIQGVPAGERSYLSAMAADDGPARTGVLARRLGVSPQHANVYRRRLLDAGLIAAPERGVVEFTLPFMRDYLADPAGGTADPRSADELARELAEARAEIAALRARQAEGGPDARG